MTKPLAGLFKARQKEAARPALYARGMRLCGEHLAVQGAGTTPPQARLTQAIGALAASLDSPAADHFDALLQVGERALEAGGDSGLGLALGVAETSARIRERSKGAWRLRGLALDGLGRGDEALECYERYVTLLPNGEAAPEVARRMDTLRRRRACLDAAVALFPEAGSALRDLLGQPHATTAAVSPRFAAYVRARVAEHGLGDPGVRRLLELYGTYRRLVERAGMPDPLLGGGTPIGVGGLRGLVAGRTVCLVANAGDVAGSTLGAEIDRYDLVVRCDAFRVRAEGTGERTDLHAVSLRGDTPWEGPAWTRPAGVRLVFGDPAAAWRRATRERLVPGAQDHVGDASLRRPLGDPALLGEDGWGTATTTAFTVLRLLDFLDASPRLDLIGFTLPGRLRPREAEWVMDRATHVDDSKMRIALR
ncbi:tetratricopeptide repeat protein [Streptomyces thinghirensis]|uniref:Tetratricopeptide repeat protein n=1 Tax=Streptomyces thinghirensis TaxID=551547 RepID=A0ABP9TBR0_9ACTN